MWDSEVDNLADEAVVDDLDAQVVAVPAPVLKHRHDPPTTIGGGEDRSGVLQRQRERFVDSHVAPGPQRRLRERPVGVMGEGSPPGPHRRGR